MIRWMLLFLACTSFLQAYSQVTGIIPETWDPKPALHTVDPSLKTESAVIIMDKRRIEYIDENKELVQYRTLHKIIRVNDDKGIGAMNEVYLPVTNNSDILDIRVRTILPGGKVIELDKKNIKDLKDENDEVYKIFAVEGLEKGSEFEYYYTYRKPAGFFGREVMQSQTPVIEAKLEIVCPQRLVFEIKPFNSKCIPVDTLLADRRMFYAWEKDIPGVENEKYSAFEANLKRFEFKLCYNTSRNDKTRLLTWDELARRMYENYSKCSNGELKKVNDLVSEMAVKGLVAEKDKIIAIENYIKKNFTTREDMGGEDAGNLEKIIKSKLASHDGIVRLYGAVFSNLGIPFEYVFAGNREKYSIDKNFENWSNCENQVIYFPTLKKFMAPTSLEYRFPWMEPYWCNTNGLYCKTTTIGNFTTAFAEIRNIPLEDKMESLININAEVDLNGTRDTLNVNIHQIFGGYAASTYKSLFNFSDAENQRLITKQMIKFGTNSENIISTKIENQDFESYSENKPFILSGVVKSGELVEKAGNKIIIKIGALIGEQVEMYQEKPRQFPMEIQFPHVLERNIVFNIPDGYIVKNPQDINIDHVYQEEGRVTMGFTSAYKLEGNKLTINILEQYQKTYYPLSQYEDFKKVINAAADFNKVSLLLEKK